MDEHEIVELDARVALALDVGLPRPKHQRTEEEWRRYYAEYAAALDELRRGAEAGELVLVTGAEVARAAAELAELNDPRRPETIEILVALVLLIQQSGVMNGRTVYMIGGLDDFGWPTDPAENLEAHVIAALDLGLFDPPGQPRREWVDAEADWELPPNAATLSVTRSILQSSPAVITQVTEGFVPPLPPPPPTLRERFLSEWEAMLDRVMDSITEELMQNDHLDVDDAG